MRSTSSFRRILLFNLLFLITGIAQHLIAYELDDRGLGKKVYNNVIASAQPLGAVVIGCVWSWREFNRALRHRSKEWFRKYWYLVPLDLLGGVCTQISIALIGSGIFTVVYSIVVGYIAILGRLCYPSKRISYSRWFSLGTICVSVMLSAMGEILANTHQSSMNRVLGVVAALGAVIFYGTLYVQLNVVLEKKDSPSPVELCVLISACESVVNLIYFLSVVYVHWNDWIAEPVLEGGSSISYVVTLLVVITIIDGFHQIGFFECCSFSKIAALTSGVNKSAQAVGLFVFSDLIFCGRSDDSRTQCMNTYKIIGTIGVSLSVLAYAFDSQLFSSCADKSDSYYERLNNPSSNLETDSPPVEGGVPMRHVSEVEVVVSN